MSNLLSLKDSLHSILKGENDLPTNKNPSNKPIFSEEFFLSSFNIFLQYCHANKKLEMITETELEKLRNKHNEVMKSLEQTCSERNSILDEAKFLITEGIKNSDQTLIIQGIALLKEIITNPIKRRE